MIPNETDAEFYLRLLNTLESDVWDTWTPCVDGSIDAPDADDERDMSQAQVMLEQVRAHIADLHAEIAELRQNPSYTQF